MSVFYPAPFALTSQPRENVCGDFLIAAGGTITTSGSYKIHTFNSSDVFNVLKLSCTSSKNDIEILVVAGGGGGGGNSGDSSFTAGGGGAGGVFHTASYNIDNFGPIPATVGVGGLAATVQLGAIYNASETGSNSTFKTFTALGGGNVGENTRGTSSGKSGGSGGGANGETCPGIAAPCATQVGGTATQPSSSTGGFGHDGAGNSDCGNFCPFPFGSRTVTRKGGGGGGAGSAATGSNGGNGVTYNFTGTPATYAEGGDARTAGSGSAPIANTGNGGHGFSDGSNGVIIIKYKYQ